MQTLQSSTQASGNNVDGDRNSFRLFSWNINGIDAFLPPQHTKIISFFKPTTPNSGNGPPRDPFFTPPNSLRLFLARHGWPEVVFLQELKIKPSDSHVLASLLASLNSPLNPQDRLADDRTYNLDAVLPRDRFNTKVFQGKLYGVGTLLRRDFVKKHVERVRDVEWDLEGRVSIVETNALASSGSGRPLALVNVYAVNGTTAPYRSPQDGTVIGTRHGHKLAFHSHLRDECLDLEDRGFDVVVAGDLNVARGTLDGHPNLRISPRQHAANRADFNAKFFGGEQDDGSNAMMRDGGVNRDVDADVEMDGMEVEEDVASLPGSSHSQEEYHPQGPSGAITPCLNAVDVFRALHGSERRYTYYPRTREWGSSCDRVDLIFVSKRLWDDGRVLDTGILDTPQERGPSDHVPLWVEIALG